MDTVPGRVYLAQVAIQLPILVLAGLVCVPTHDHNLTGLLCHTFRAFIAFHEHCAFHEFIVSFTSVSHPRRLNGIALWARNGVGTVSS